MSAFETVSQLYARYADFIDQGDFHGVAELLSECSIYDPNGQVLAAGEQQIFEMYSNLIQVYEPADTPQTQHIVSNIFIREQNSQRIRAQANYSVFQKMASGKIEAIICGYYKSLFSLSDTGWCFLEHHMHPRIIGDMSEHLSIDIGEIGRD